MKPNIIYINSHDTGRYTQPYGHAVPTPSLQKLAEEGVLFRQNFCINPTCSASRSALLVGNYPHENGMTGLAHRGWSLNDYGQHLQQTLRSAGYLTALAGDQHVAAPRDGRTPAEIIGYDRYVDSDGVKGAEILFEDPPDQPFYLEIGFGQTHRGFPPIEEAPDDPRYCLPPAPLPDTPETRQDMTRFKASARILDKKIGDILAALERSGCAVNTLVICTTDHGIAFPRMKCNLHDSGIGVMLIIRGPKGFTGGKVVDTMVSHLDIFPTVCDVAEIPSPPWLRGRSLTPLVNDDIDSLHEELFFEVNYHAAYEPMRAVRTSRWKYIKRYDGRKKPVLVNCDQGESKQYWMKNEWADQELAEEQLFDLCFDPNETNNLIGAKGYGAIADDLRAKLHAWMEETSDPLLQGLIPAPEGARVNSPDDVSLR